MDELNKEEKIYTEEKKNTKNQNKKCTDIPPVDARVYHSKHHLR